MREILFRAKRIDNGEWVEGWYQPPIVGIHCDGRKESLGASLSIIGNYGFLEDVYIIPETVGQFTGLTDKNGKPIYEDDIVQAYFRNNHSKQIFRVVFGDGMFLFDNNHVKVPKYEIYSMKVIGNIHDNPELLEVTEND